MLDARAREGLALGMARFLNFLFGWLGFDSHGCQNTNLQIIYSLFLLGGKYQNYTRNENCTLLRFQLIKIQAKPYITQTILEQLQVIKKKT